MSFFDYDQYVIYLATLYLFVVTYNKSNSM